MSQMLLILLQLSQKQREREGENKKMMILHKDLTSILDSEQSHNSVNKYLKILTFAHSNTV